MYEDELNKYLISDYKEGALLIRKKFLPLVVYPGKIEGTYYFTVPISNNQELNKEFHTWFYNDFREIVYDIVKKRNIDLKENQANPDYKKLGWYLPMSIYLEIIKMWQEENVPIITDILRPPEAIYGRRNWENYKADIIAIVKEYFGEE